MHYFFSRALTLLCLFSALGCQPSQPLELEPGCNPLLAGLDCMLPYPSDFFRNEDPTMPSGYRILREGAAKLYTKDGHSADPDEWLQPDGFSIAPTILARFGQALSPENLVNVMDAPTLSQSPNSSATLIIDSLNKTFVAHYADIDPRVEDLTQQALSLHPFAPLEPNRRYIVAIHQIKDAIGNPISAPEGFRRLRDKDLKGDEILEALEKNYNEEIFPLLKEMGLKRKDLQLAWEFSTGSHEDKTKDLFRIKKLTQVYLETNDIVLVIEEDLEQTNDDLVWRHIKGKVIGPDFIDEQNPKVLLRDEEQNIQQQGTKEIPFFISLPTSLKESTSAAPMIAYGHGFFGTRKELTYSGARHLSNALGAPFIAIDWFGMRHSDRISILADITTDMPSVASFVDRVHQGMSHWLVISHLVKNRLWEEQALQGAETGNPLYDPEEYYYMGISQGHILGGALAAIDENLSRFNFQVGGAGFSSMMFRARPFRSFLFALGLMLDNPLEERKLAAVLQHHLDRIDPSTYASYLEQTSDTRPILMQIALGDVEVPNPASFFHARAINLKMTGPSPKELWGIPVVDGSMPNSALTLFDFDEDTSFYRNAQAPEALNDVHGNLRMQPAATQQIKTFFSKDGGIIHPCDDICNPN